MQWHDRIGRRLTLRDLHTLNIVAQRGSMARAAADLAVTQPAVSKAIAEMERMLGVRLLDRVAQGVEPTPHGRALLKWGVAIFDDMRQAVNEIGFLSEATGGELRIGGSEPILAGLVPAVIDRLSRRYPRIIFGVTQANNIAQLHRDLRERKLDLVITRTIPTAGEDLHTEILFEDPLLVAVGERNRWARRRKIRLAELTDEPWCLQDPNTVVGRSITEAFRASGLDVPRGAIVASSMQLSEALLATGRFVTLLPRSVISFSGKRLPIKVLPIKLPASPPPVGITRLKNRTVSPVAQLFIDCAHAAAKPLVRSK